MIALYVLTALFVGFLLGLATDNQARKKLEEHARIDQERRELSHSGPHEHHLGFNDYQIANLKSLLKAVMSSDYGGSPFNVANTGDWVGETFFMLANTGIDAAYQPHKLAAQLAQEAKNWRFTPSEERRWVLAP